MAQLPTNYRWTTRFFFFFPVGVKVVPIHPWSSLSTTRLIFMNMVGKDVTYIVRGICPSKTCIYFLAKHLFLHKTWTKTLKKQPNTQLCEAAILNVLECVRSAARTTIARTPAVRTSAGSTGSVAGGVCRSAADAHVSVFNIQRYPEY